MSEHRMDTEVYPVGHPARVTVGASPGPVCICGYVPPPAAHPEGLTRKALFGAVRAHIKEEREHVEKAH